MAYIMIVDDDDDFADAVGHVLEKTGHEVHIERSTRQATARMRARRPDLVLLDVMFPESSSAGFELARKIRHYEPDLQGIPVLLLTGVNARFPLGFSNRDLDDNWLPAADFLDKPVDFDALVKRIEELIERPSPGGCFHVDTA